MEIVRKAEAVMKTVRRDLSIAEWRFALLMVFLFVSGFVAHVTPSLQHLTSYTADIFLLGINSTLLWFIYQSNCDSRLWFWVGGTYLFTFFVEAAGVATGAIFGEYTYGEGLKWQWLGVPFVIALNWTLLILAINDLVMYWLRSTAAITVTAGLSIAVYDWFIEPVAIVLDYWSWAGGSEVPVQNYLAWAVVGIMATIPLLGWKIRFRHSLLSIYLVVQWLYFLAMQLFLS